MGQRREEENCTREGGRGQIYSWMMGGGHGSGYGSRSDKADVAEAGDGEGEYAQIVPL